MFTAHEVVEVCLLLTCYGEQFGERGRYENGVVVGLTLIEL